MNEIDDEDLPLTPEATDSESAEWYWSKRATRGGTLLGVLLYGVIIGVNFEPAVRDKHVEAFGALPFGYPVTQVVIFIESLLYLPVLPAFWHIARISAQANWDGTRFGIVYLLNVNKSHPQLRRSQSISIACMFYALIIMFS